MDEESDFKKITIIGVGLIGGSLGLALRKDRPKFKIVGVDKKEVIEKAMVRGAIDEGTVNFKEGVKEADIVIMATPVKTILDLLPKISPFLKKGCLITDTGSTKVKIVETANQVLSSDIHFIGGHPMAGSEKYGIDSADSHLFQEKTYILTPTKKINLMAIEKIFSLIKIINANILILDPLEHDRVVGTISHLPQIIAISLINVVGRLVQEENNNNYLRAVGGGFKDMTRIAQSPCKIWEDICDTNKETILEIIQKFKEYLNLIEDRLINDPEGLREEFQKARRLREVIENFPHLCYNSKGK